MPTFICKTCNKEFERKEKKSKNFIFAKPTYCSNECKYKGINKEKVFKGNKCY